MFKRFVAYYKPYKKVFFTDMFCALVVAASGLVFPMIIRHMQYEIFPLGDASTVLKQTALYCFYLFLLYVVQSLAQFYVTSIGHIMGARMETDMRRDLFSHINKLSFSFFDKTNTGHLISRILADLFDITELAHHGPEDVFISVIKIVGAFIILGLINWQVTLVLIVVTAIMAIFSFKYNRKMHQSFMQNRKNISDINATAQDSLSGIRTVKSFTNESLEEEKFAVNNNRFLDSKKKNYMIMGTYHGVNGFLQGLLYVAVMGASGWQITKGNMLPGDIIIYILYINMFLEPVRRLINFTEQFQKGYTGFLRMVEVLDTEPEIEDREDAIEAKNLKGDIEFDDVSFHYDDDDEDTPVLNHLNVTIPAKHTVALVGPSGAGKTTFCSLIPRFYEVTGGAVKVDGVDVRDYKLNSLRGNIGVVQQDVYMFDTTIRENILYGKPGASDEEIIMAAKRANLHDFIMTLPHGYDTKIGERGVRFSGGQKQRISIARVFLQNPPILILDEATSSLDNESEIFIQESLDELSAERTTIVIAHRLSTVRNADRILVLTEDGITESGTHDELMNKNGLYHKLYNMQFHE